MILYYFDKVLIAQTIVFNRLLILFSNIKMYFYLIYLYFSIEPKPVIQHIKIAVSASNSLVRVAAISALGVLYLYLGSQLTLFFENENPILVQQITAEFEKVLNYILIW